MSVVQQAGRVLYHPNLPLRVRRHRDETPLRERMEAHALRAESPGRRGKPRPRGRRALRRHGSARGAAGICKKCPDYHESSARSGPRAWSGRVAAVGGQLLADGFPAPSRREGSPPKGKQVSRSFRDNQDQRSLTVNGLFTSLFLLRSGESGGSGVSEVNPGSGSIGHEALSLA